MIMKIQSRVVGVCLPLQALTTIVRRDFFPDVPKLQAQLEFIEASETNDYERLRAISERFPTSQYTPQPAGECFPNRGVVGFFVVSISP